MNLNKVNTLNKRYKQTVKTIKSLNYKQLIGTKVQPKKKYLNYLNANLVNFFTAPGRTGPDPKDTDFKNIKFLIKERPIGKIINISLMDMVVNITVEFENKKGEKFQEICEATDLSEVK